MRIACIGSRNIKDSEKHLNVCRFVGAIIAGKGWYVASGNAEGADHAYAEGANIVNPRQVILYLPEENHFPQHIVEGNRVTSDIQDSWRIIAKQHHPAYDKLKPYVQRLMDRNAGILSRAEKCIAWLNHDKPGFGGTGHGWRIAADMKIPRLDLSCIKSFEEIKNFLTD